MDFLSFIYLAVLLALGWFWLNSIRVLELARHAGKQACIKQDLQFLDDTVARVGLKIARNSYGHRVFRRSYHFEFSETGNTRIDGQIVMLGNEVESVTMDPYQILPAIE